MKHSGLLITIILLLVFPTLAGCSTGNGTEATTTSTNEPKNVVFSDFNLETAIRDTLGKRSEEEILFDELANLTVLLASNKGINDTTGIEQCVNLTELDLSNNQIIDISPLSGLTNLEVLKLNMNEIINISAISNLINLRWLNIQDNDIGDIWPLAYNAGLGEGDRVLLAGNGILIVEHTGPWDVVTELEDRGVELHTSYSW